MWPALLGCVAFVFSGEFVMESPLYVTIAQQFLAFTLCAFYKRRLEFSQFLSTYNSLSMNRYIRLMMLALAEMLCTIPIGIYSVYIANKGVPIQPWVSWAVTHYEFSYVGQIPAAVWMSDPNFRLSVELTRWLFPASGLLFFLLFGLGTEARKNYRAAFLRVAKLFGYKPASEVPVNTPQKFVISIHHTLTLLSCFLLRWKSNLNKNISVGSLPVYVPNTSAYVKRKGPLVSSGAKCFDVDVEKAAGCSSPSLPSYSSQEQLTRTATCTGGSDENEDAPMRSAASNVHSTDRSTIPAYHRPFSQPSVYPTPRRALQDPRSLDSICITIQTQYATII